MNETLDFIRHYISKCKCNERNIRFLIEYFNDYFNKKHYMSLMIILTN